MVAEMFKLLRKEKGFTLLENNTVKSNKDKNKYLTGFSLIEILITIVIIGLFAAFTAYSLTNSRPKARLAVAQSQLGALQNYLVICANDGDDVDWMNILPVANGVTKICEHANAVAIFPELPDHWRYVLASDLGMFKAVSDEGDLWEIECSETGCVTTTPTPEE